MDPFRALGRVLIRDSKDTTRPGLAVGRADWARFVRYVTEARESRLEVVLHAHRRAAEQIGERGVDRCEVAVAGGGEEADEQVGRRLGHSMGDHCAR
ncbi:DUF397 domain-containing protein [Streptomyces iranensis]|uniref:DUF397 domain-containing protein n=1 Tax=Streptomyces iranensis TaxID=576784 RepID=UPI0039B79263